jgi:hypothetical protein
LTSGGPAASSRLAASLENTMQLPFMIFGVDTRATAVTAAMLQQWPHLEHPTGFTTHFFLDMLDERGVTYVCRFFGMMALRMLRIGREDAMAKYDIFLPDPVGDERFDKDIDSNVARLIIDDEMRPRHIAVGLSSSSLMLNIAERDEDRTQSVGRCVPFTELHALGPDAASITVGDIILRALIMLHPDAFAPFPNLSHHS